MTRFCVVRAVDIPTLSAFTARELASVGAIFHEYNTVGYDS